MIASSKVPMNVESRAPSENRVYLLCVRMNHHYLVLMAVVFTHRFLEVYNTEIKLELRKDVYLKLKAEGSFHIEL